jgi:hypothetical protein
MSPSLLAARLGVPWVLVETWSGSREEVVGVYKIGCRVLWGAKGTGVAQLRRVWIVMRLPLNCTWLRNRVQGWGNSMGLILESRSPVPHLLLGSVAYGKAAACVLMMRCPLWVADARSNGPDSVMQVGERMFR